MRWAGHGARVGEMRNAYKSLVRKLKERDHAEDLGVDVRIILEWILGKQGREGWTGFIWLRIGNGAGLL